MVKKVKAYNYFYKHKVLLISNDLKTYMECNGFQL
jgi:hypothetical protein